MSIQDISDKFKGLVANDLVFHSMLIVLVSVTSFGLGRWSTADVSRSENASVRIIAPMDAEHAVYQSSESDATSGLSTISTQSTTEIAGDAVLNIPETGMYVGSKNGTKFHLPTCPGASQIKDENKLYFKSKEEAYAKGYTEAANCKGI